MHEYYFKRKNKCCIKLTKRKHESECSHFKHVSLPLSLQLFKTVHLLPPSLG